ncbi:hypothetical protein JL39_02505 [Rhizobium sp. YS-1r]|nr:hypothetical protein JL39_02505 [Rhizobium sp. YS-1r]
MSAGGAPGVTGAGAGEGSVAAGGVVEDVVCVSVGEPPIWDHTKAPTRMTAITATQAIHEELRPRAGSER